MVRVSLWPVDCGLSLLLLHQIRLTVVPCLAHRQKDTTRYPPLVASSRQTVVCPCSHGCVEVCPSPPAIKCQQLLKPEGVYMETCLIFCVCFKIPWQKRIKSNLYSLVWLLKNKTKQKTNVARMWSMESLCIFGGNVKQCNHQRKQYGSS